MSGSWWAAYDSENVIGPNVDVGKVEMAWHVWGERPHVAAACCKVVHLRWHRSHAPDSPA